MRALAAGGRIANAMFFLATTIFAILTYSPFAYEQFIQPNMIAWLSNFVFLHTDFYWLALCITLLTLAPTLKSSTAGAVRVLAWAYLAVGVGGGILLSTTRMLPAGDTPVRSLAVAFLALVPIVWLGVIDRLAATRTDRRAVDDDDRSLAVVLAAAVFVWAAFASTAPARLHAAGGISASNATPQLAIGIGASLVAHVAAGTIAFLAIASARRLGIPLAVLVSLLLGVALHEIVMTPISVTGGISWALAEAIAAALVVWATGIARMLDVGDAARRRWAVAALLLVPVVAFGVVPLLTTFDWGFMLQKLAALLTASMAYAAATALSRARPAGVRVSRALTAAAIVLYVASESAIPRLAAWFHDPRLQPAFALDAYSAADPSYRVLRQFLRTDQGVPGDAAFYGFLRANSSIKAELEPVDVDFASDLKVKNIAAGGSPPPSIYLFIIDSLRRDYLSVYNPKVTFTPQIEAFARDSFVFTRAFSRYGGTGLAVPSIWAGALVAHKQYVTPFAPMNALAKLLDAGNYRRVITRDHITDELFGLGEGTSVLDYGVLEMMHTFCATASELKEELRSHADDPRPVFAHTRPLDLHIGNTRFAAVPAGESYPGFFEPYASRVHHIDACFGDFIAQLKSTGRYDNSIIIVMADHGDSLGEGLRWGHGYTIVPEVLRIPLIVRIPTALRSRFTADVTRLTFATDLTPSLYTLLGVPPTRPRGAAGTSMFTAPGEELPSRRRDAYLVASSYGAVYGIVRHNGRRLYIADAIEGRDAMYDLSPAAGDERLGMTDAERQANRALIREQIDDLARWYGYPHP